MSEPVKTLRPVHAQTSARATADEQDRAFEQQRPWIVRKQKREERRADERRAGERRQKERRSKPRRADERRQDGRLSDDRRADERRASERRAEDRRDGERRRTARPSAPLQRTPPTRPRHPGTRRKGIIDEYA